MATLQELTDATRWHEGCPRCTICWQHRHGGSCDSIDTPPAFRCRCGQAYTTQRELLAHFTRRPTRTHQAARADPRPPTMLEPVTFSD
jgi:hypothetical protein